MYPYNLRTLGEITMEKGDDMQILMEQLLPCLYSRFVPNLVNKVTEESFVPSGCITKDNFQKILIVLSKKQLLISQRWENFVAINCLKMLSSHEMFLEYIMFACIIETALSADIFDSVLSASALLIAISIEILEKTDVNFCGLTVDIFMVFYKSVLKEQFCEEGGFEHFVGYLRHEYLKWESFLNDDPDDCNYTERYRDFLKNANNQLDKELKKVRYQPDFIDYNDIRNSICHSLAKEVLSATKVRLPTIPSLAYLNAAYKQKVEKLKETKKSYTIASKSETTLSSSKFEMVVSALKSETTLGALNSKRIEDISSSKPETIVSTSKFKTTIEVLKSETTKEALKSETTKEALKSETTKEALKSETIISAVKSETTTGALKSGPIVLASKSETTVLASKSETAISTSKSRTPSTLKDEMASVLQRCSSTVADSKASIVVEKLNIAWCDNIVRSVLNYNNSKSTRLVNEDKRIKKVDEILEHLKDTIKSLVEVLEA